MQKTDGIITSERDGLITTEHLLTYSEEERQQNTINQANAALIFQPAFIPFYPSIQKQHKLTDTETKLYGFIWFYLSNSPDKRFYFTNEQLAEILNCGTASVTRSIKTLEDNKLFSFSYRRRADGGLIRYVKGGPTNQNDYSQKIKMINRDSSKRLGNNNKINNNKINKREHSLEFLRNLTEQEIQELQPLTAASPVQIREKAIMLADYCEAHGKKYRDYKAFLRNALRKDFPKKVIHTTLADMVRSAQRNHE